ncbi:MAG: SpoIID/LytB domain-containing protein [Endomicrobium sp.]|jgi:stage II sporulation protein D|nr:SpoIID/LytB domain-containing protein [Endomicrobium sp.]
MIFKNVRGILILFMYIVFTCKSLYALGATNRNVDIGICIDVSSASIGCSKSFIILDNSGKKLKFSKGVGSLECITKGIKINNYILYTPVKVTPSNNIIFVNSKPYLGQLTIQKSKTKMTIINVLPIEEYLKGVVPKEVNPLWPTEALKAQAVISRTYTIANLNKHKEQGFNLCSTTHCQVYGGLSGQVHSTNQAVKETNKEVLTYEDKVIQAVFHATCGGRTDSPRYVWGWKDIPPYLKGVKCGYCHKARYKTWEHTLDEHFIHEKLSQNNKIGKIKKIKVKGKTPTKAAKGLEIIHSEGKLRLNAYKFRTLIDAWKIKSHTFDSIEVKNNKVYFKGKGWGHKVGLCQEGAKGMADKGKTYKKILLYFYPKTKIEPISYREKKC